MNDLFFAVFGLSSIAIIVFVVLAVLQFAKKDSVIGKKQLKFAGISLALVVISFIGFGITSEPTETAKEEVVAASANKTEQLEDVEESEEEKAARLKKEAEEKAAAEKKAKEQAEAKAKAEAEETEKQVEYFKSNTQPFIDEMTSYYDKGWNDVWKPTFEAISTGSTNVYQAYDNMKILKDYYRNLSTNMNNVPVEGLSKDHQKTLKKAFGDLSYAAVSRQMAADKAMKMFDEGNYSPSYMDKIKSDIASADSQMLSAVVAIATVKVELGIE